MRVVDTLRGSVLIAKNQSIEEYEDVLTFEDHYEEE